MKVGKDVRFSTVPEWLIFHEGVKAHAIRVWAVLDRKADTNSGECEVSIAEVAEKARCSRTTVKAALRQLEQVGALEVERDRKTELGDPDTNRYTLRTSDPGGRSQADRGGSQDDQGVSQDVTDPDAEGGSPDDRGVGRETTTRDESSKSESTKAKGLARPRPRNPVWDALVVEFGEPATKTERSVLGKAVKDLREGLELPDEEIAERVCERAAEHRRRWPNVDCTATSLLKHWTLLGRPPPPGEHAEPAGFAGIREFRRRIEKGGPNGDHRGVAVGGGAAGRGLPPPSGAG